MYVDEGGLARGLGVTVRRREHERLGQKQDRLARRLADGVRVANKTGNFADVIHDGGIVTWPGGTLVIAVLTQGVRPGWQAMDTIAEIAAVLVQMCAGS